MCHYQPFFMLHGKKNVLEPEQREVPNPLSSFLDVQCTYKKKLRCSNFADENSNFFSPAVRYSNVDSVN